MKKALVTGITGQDGKYLAHLLKDKGYSVVGLLHARGDGSGEDEARRVLPFAEFVSGDLKDLPSLISAIERSQPDEIYNLAALSSVSQYWLEPELTAEITGVGALRLLEAIRISGGAGRIRFYQASSSEMYGAVDAAPQDESTPLRPVHPYGAAKAFAHHTTATYRQVQGMFAVSGILFNHESPYRSEAFVTRKITRGVARISLGLQEGLVLGNLDVRRDWGYAPEYVEAMWMMMQQETPEDYVIATGKTHSVRDFVDVAFRRAGIEDWQPYVFLDVALLRPADIAELRGNPEKARNKLGWTAATEFEDLVGIMLDADLERERSQQEKTGADVRGT
jgi:GDPmannose 4,6-dehydratase